MRSLKPVLLLEDDNVDAMTVIRAMKELKVSNPLVRVVNGEEAILYLQDDANVKPCVILLDLNMPKMNGVEFLKIIKADPILRGIPVVVFTTSKGDQDKNECFDLGIAGYIVKPVGYQRFLEAMRILDLYWTLSEMPGNAAEQINVELENTVSRRD
jgi:CheY-like chemotaxis protein